ncbi:MAG TPA: hypothetical protein VER03_09655 [Bryobacteraceae bacterium]|nr:hypothetical protein [Bryobacteraceae bacterium]
MRCSWLFVVSAALAGGQVLVETSRVPEPLRDMQAEDSTGELRCSVSPFKPRLNYSFRFQTGYVLEVPLEQYSGKGHSIATLLRVTPENDEREPIYLVSRTRLPEIPPTKAVLELGGGYVVGEGKYRVDMLVSDDEGRTCTKKWNLSAKLNRKEDDVPPGMAPGTVDEISLRKWMRSTKGPRGEEGYRLTVLMNVAPVMPRRLRLGAYDRVLLLSSFTSLIERIPLRSVRLVLFNLDQQREIYRDENFEPANFSRVAQALNALELGTVSYDVVKNRNGHIDLLSELMEDARKDDRSDAVVFLGPKPWRFEKAPKSALPERSGNDPAFFYVQLRPFLAAAALQDTIMSAVKHMGGKTFDVYSPGDFAEAIRDVTKALELKRSTSAAIR